jgi:hypothetical protein
MSCFLLFTSTEKGTLSQGKRFDKLQDKLSTICWTDQILFLVIDSETSAEVIHSAAKNRSPARLQIKLAPAENNGE